MPPKLRSSGSPFTAHDLETLKARLARVGSLAGLFKDRVTGGRWRGRRQRVRAVVYRRMRHPREAGLALAELGDVCVRIMTALAVSRRAAGMGACSTSGSCPGSTRDRRSGTETPTGSSSVCPIRGTRICLSGGTSSMHEGLKTGKGSIRSSSFHRPCSIHKRSTNDGRAQHLRRRFTVQTESDRLLGGG